PEVHSASLTDSTSATRSTSPKVRLTNLDKIFWPEDGYTKGDLVEYYRTIAPWLLPYLADRPLVLTRFPDGIHGKSFFQKDAPGFAPDWLRTETLWSEGSERELRYFVGGDEATLVYIANSASIPLHVWASRVGSLELPDWCILDLDPKGAPFAHVVEVARTLKALCDDITLPCFVKTSGSSGLHVMVPLGRQLTHEQSRQLGELIARVVVAELPGIATIARVVSQREGKVYIDYLQNGHGKLLVAPYSVRPLPGAPVSMPLEWREVDKRLDIRRYTIVNALKRMKRLGSDPLRPVLEVKPDLIHALGALAQRT
ncbi:MAG: non-homologous end-joining DNA ligase, partial [Longimicrobiales bacterium]